MRLLKLRTKIILFTALLLFGVIIGSFILIDHVVRDQVRRRLVHDLERSQHNLEQSQKDRLSELVAYSIIASENSTLKAAIETFQAERLGASPILTQLRRTVDNEANKLFTVLAADLLIITDNTAQVLTVQASPSLPVPSGYQVCSKPGT